MSNALYAIYLKEVFKLAKTLVVKSDMTANAINNEIRDRQLEVIDSQPETWKYYMNLAGEYHFTDTPMTVVSMDTLETIAFTKENLQIHRATAIEYAYGTRYYRELLSRFPLQEDLILGILNPIDKQTAISAYEGEILYFDPLLVEDNEYNLIPKLQQWINGFLVRWHNPDYQLTDDLYPTTVYAVLFANMPAQILNIRLENCKTSLVHSYHIRQYLASNGKLDVYMDLLTKKQALWLYRNIRWIQRNAGKTDTFELLIDRILTDRGFPIAAYDLRHNLAGQPDNIYPDVELIQNPINLKQIEGRNDLFTVEEVLSKELPLARDNIKVYAEAEVEITTSMQNNPISLVPTKVLESSVVDLSDEGPFTLGDALLNHWLLFSTTDRYKAVVSFTNPLNGEKVLLTSKDAFTFFLYCYNRANGIELSSIPRLEAINVRRIPTPTFAALRNITEQKHLPDSFIVEGLSDLAPIGQYISTDAFYEACVGIHSRLRRHRLQWSLQEDLHARGQGEAALRHLYANIPCVLSDTTDYLVWLHEKGLVIDEFTRLDFDLIAVELVANATGVSINSRRALKELQEGMIRLMTQLSSYSIQFVSTINTEPYTVLDWSAIRLGDWQASLGATIRNSQNNVDIVRSKVRGLSEIKIDIPFGNGDYKPHVRMHDTIDIDPDVTVDTSSRIVYEVRAFSAPIYINNVSFTGDNLEGFLTVRNLSGFDYQENLLLMYPNRELGPFQ